MELTLGEHGNAGAPWEHTCLRHLSSGNLFPPTTAGLIQVKCQVYCGICVLMTMWQGDGTIPRPWSRLQCYIALPRACAWGSGMPFQGLWFLATSEKFLCNNYRLVLWLLLKMLPVSLVEHMGSCAHTASHAHGDICISTCEHTCTDTPPAYCMSTVERSGLAGRGCGQG